jgi:hypothetical protein
MRNRKLTLFTALLIGFTAAYAQPHVSQDAVRALKEDPTRAGNNTNSYEFKEIRDTKAPKGYNPFYISHYGRHGSRNAGGTVLFANRTVPPAYVVYFSYVQIVFCQGLLNIM